LNLLKLHVGTVDVIEIKSVVHLGSDVTKQILTQILLKAVIERYHVANFAAKNISKLNTRIGGTVTIIGTDLFI